MTYSYFPGAADDEESWACGLTPQLMWRHLRALLAAGPAGIEALVRQLVEEQQQQAQPQQQQQQHQVSAALQAASLPGGEQQVVGPPAGLLPAPGSTAGSEAPQQQQGAARPLHDLLPQGCLPAQAATVQRLGGGIYLLGSTGLAISGAAAAAAPGVWQYADAVLHLGTVPLAGMQHEPQPASQQHQQQDKAPGSRHDCSSRLSDGPAAALASCRYCWLPVRSSKLERHSLLQQLPAVLRCARAQLQQGRRLLVCCDSGLDVSVCVAVACLLAFYRLHEQPGGGSRLSPAWVGPGITLADGSSSQQGAAARPGLGMPEPLPPVVGSLGFSKLAVRQHLAAVSAHYPAARPTRGSLRQVFNFFLEQLGRGQAADGEGEA